MHTATRPKQYIHVTGFVVETIKDGIIPVLLAFDSYSLFILKMEASKELTDEVFVKFIQNVVDGKDMLSAAKPVIFVIDTDYGTEEELLELIDRDIKLICDTKWNEKQLKKVMPGLKTFVEDLNKRTTKQN